MTVEVCEDLTQEEYELFRRLIYAHSRINLGQEKMHLVRARLGKRIRAGSFASYRAYYEYVKNDRSGRELCSLLDAISTNTTHLFREMQHFEFLAERLKAWAVAGRWPGRGHTVRIWSAGCSSGEEPHSVVITATEALRAHPQLALRVLATDLSTRMLERARAALYEPHRLGTVPETYRRRAFRKVTSDGTVYAQVAPELQRLITFARLNLMAERFPFRHGFDAVFCRNVMIYFDRPTQAKLVHKFARHLLPGGYLLIGHSESLNGIDHALRYVRPTIYQKAPS